MGAVNSEVIGGVNSYVLYGVQTLYSTAVTPNKIFGGLIKSAKFNTDRQYNERPGFRGTNEADGRITAQQLPGTVSTSCDVEFDAQRFDWLEELFMNNRTGAGTTGSPYSYTIGNVVKPITLSEEIKNVETDSIRTYPGMLINSASFSCAVGEPLSISLNLIGGKTVVNTILTSPIDRLTDDLFNFSGGSITFDTTLVDNIIDNVSVDITNDVKLAYGFSEEAKSGKPGKLGLTMKFTAKYLDDTRMTAFGFGATGVGTQVLGDVKLKFTKGTNKYVEFVFSNVAITRVGTNHDLNEFIVEETDLIPRNVTVYEVV